MKALGYRLTLALVGAVLAGCVSAAPGPRAGGVTVILLDSAVDRDFVEGRMVGLSFADVSHGSLVGRVLRSYCRTPIVAIPVEGLRTRINRAGYLQGLRRAVRYAREHPGTRIVVNASLSSLEPDDEEAALVAQLVRAGVLFVAAAGNDDADHLTYPAAYPGVIGVASATVHGKALHSNYGPHVDIAASGDIMFVHSEFLPYEWLRRQMEAHGTSFAAPRVAGTVAYVLERRPELSPAQAYRLVVAAARPIDDEVFRSGALGAGLLDVHATRAAVTPYYRFTQFTLPISIWVVLGVVCAYLIVRYGLVGVFLTLMIWLVVLPASVLLVTVAARSMEFVGGGSRLAGLGAFSLVCAALALSAALQAWQPVKSLCALAGPVLAAVLLGAAGLSPDAGPVALAAAAAAAGLLVSAGWELSTRRRLKAVRAAAGPEALDRLLRVYGRAFDRRVRAAATDAIGRTGTGRAVTFLLRVARDSQAAASALAHVARDHPAQLRPWLQRFAFLDESARDRLAEALRQGWGLAIAAVAEDAVRHDPSGDLARLADELGGIP